MAIPKSVPLSQSPLSAGFWDKNRGRVIGVFALAVAIVGLVLFIQHREESTEAAGWNAILDPAQPLMIQPEIDLAGPVQGTSAEPWAIYTSALRSFSDKELDKAEGLVTRLQAEFADHPINVGDTVPKLLADIQAEKSWTAAHQVPEKNPDPGSDHSVTLSTSLGDVTIGLYPDRAPAATRAFLDLLRTEGLTAGSFDEAQRDRYILLSLPTKEGGSDATEHDHDTDGEHEADKPSDLAQGKVADRNNLSHYAGAVSFFRAPLGLLEATAKPRIAIYLEDSPRKDTEEVVFGMVTAGLDILKQASTRDPVEGEARLQEPLAVTGLQEGTGLAEIR